MTAVTEAPSKCDATPGAGVPRNPCTVPGSQPRCQLCPASPTFWRRKAVPS